MPVTLESVLSNENLFLVLTKDGKKRFILAKDQDDLPEDIADVSFAASLAEMEMLVEEMKKVMALSVDDCESGIEFCAGNEEISNDTK